MNLLAFNREEKKVLSFLLFKESCLEGRYPILMKNFNQLNGTFYRKENVIFIETPGCMQNYTFPLLVVII